MIDPEQAFINVMEAGSFKKAAEQLNMSASSLSRKVATLEKRLKAKLLFRSTSNSQPTEVGQTYYNGIRKIRDDRLALEEEIFSGVNAIKGKLRIGSTPDLAEKFIVPVILDMQRSAPELNVELILNSELTNLVENNLDVAVRIGPMPDSSLIAKLLGKISRILVASPHYLDRHGAPKHIDELINHNFILYSPGQAKKDIEFVDGSIFSHSNIKSNICVNSLHSIYKLVKKGAGINSGPKWRFNEELKKGTLVEVLPEHTLKGFPVHAVYASRSFLPKKTDDLIKRITKEISSIDKI